MQATELAMQYVTSSERDWREWVTRDIQIVLKYAWHNFRQDSCGVVGSTNPVPEV